MIAHESPQSAAIRHALERRGKGVCISCGVPVEKEGNWPRCAPCQKKHDAYPGVKRAKAENARRARLRKRAAGLCAARGCKEPGNGKHLCVRHLKLQREAVARYKARKAAQ